jgi:hypothetical protein
VFAFQVSMLATVIENFTPMAEHESLGTVVYYFW